MKSVLIIISTYNGARYLREQLDSIYNQTYNNIQVFVRDDGSIDDTIKILNEYKNKGLIYYKGENKKPALSFLDALSCSSNDYDYYAFCDQDDVWNPEKVESALIKLEANDVNIPALYYSATELVDASLNHIGIDYRLPIYSKNICTSLLNGSLITGCTMVINKSLSDLIRRGTPEKPLMHDSWIHRVCLSVGGIIISDPIPHIKYRQHDNNVLGIHKVRLSEKIIRALKKNTIHRQNAIDILCIYSDLIRDKEKKFLNYFIKYNSNFNSFFHLLLIVASNKSDNKTKFITLFKILTLRY